MFIFAEHCDNQPEPAHHKDVVHKELTLKNRKNESRKKIIDIQAFTQNDD